MMSDNISPEERLFNAIEKGEGDSSNLPRKLPRKTFSLTGLLGNLRGKRVLSDFKKRFFLPRETFGFLRGKPPDIAYNLKLANRVLVVSAMLLVIFLIADLILPKYSIDKLYATASDLGAWQFQKRHITPLKAFSFYEEAARTRDLFNPALKEAKGVSVPVNLKLQELTKDLSLVGIYWGTHPEVMIEDTAGKKTYFLKKGEEIKGIKIKNILEDRVILRYGDEEMEFR